MDARTDDGGEPGSDASDGGNVDRCTTPPVGGLVKGEAINVFGRIDAIAIGADDMRTYAGWYSTAFVGSLDFAGTAAPPAQGSDGFVWRRDASGATKWLVPLGGAAADFVDSVLDDDAGNIYIAGRTYSATMTIGSLSINSQGLPYVSFLAKLRSTDGAPQWIQRITGPTTDTAGRFHNCSKLTKSGAQIIATCNFRGGPLEVIANGGAQTTIPSVGFQSGVLLAIDSSDGEITWQTRFAASSTNGIVNADTTAAPNGHLYVSGTYTHEVDIAHPTEPVLESATPNAYGRAGFWTELDAAGEPVWIRSFQHLGDPNSGPFAISVAASTTALYVTINTPTGIQFAIGSEITPAPGRDILSTFPLASPPQSVPSHVREIPPRTRLAVDRCDRPSLGVPFVDLDDFVLDGITVTENRPGLLTLAATTAATRFVGFDPCANAFGAPCLEAVYAIAMTPTGSTILAGRFSPQIDFGSGASGLGTGDQPFIAEFAP
ncbi:MAG: hypothetical protein ACKV2T_09205 [Kofleriaceae bacterium]